MLIIALCLIWFSIVLVAYILGWRQAQAQTDCQDLDQNQTDYWGSSGGYENAQEPSVIDGSVVSVSPQQSSLIKLLRAKDAPFLSKTLSLQTANLAPFSDLTASGMPADINANYLVAWTRSFYVN